LGGLGLWWEGFLEQVSFEFTVEKSTYKQWTVTVMVMGEMSIDDWDEKSVKEND